MNTVGLQILDFTSPCYNIAFSFAVILCVGSIYVNVDDNVLFSIQTYGLWSLL